MHYFEIIIKLIIGLSVLNVWLIRPNMSTQWRGGGASTLKEEFENYGLSENIMKAVGAIKIILALLLLISIFYQPFEVFGAVGMAVMMAGAVSMHLKIQDPLIKSLPAFLFLVLSLLILLM